MRGPSSAPVKSTTDLALHHLVWALVQGPMTLRRIAVAAVLAASAGCSVHSQGPIQLVAYDFSDHDFYDRAFATSPSYAAATELEAPEAPATGQVIVIVRDVPAD